MISFVIEILRVFTFVMMALMMSFRVYAEGIYQNPPSEHGAWPFYSVIPECDDPYVLRKIIHDFEVREREYWNSDLVISTFRNVQETGLRNHGPDYTPRRYCKSGGVMSDGREHDVFYNITPDQSIILSGQIIDWCIEGLDRAHVDGPHCQRVRP